MIRFSAGTTAPELVEFSGSDLGRVEVKVRSRTTEIATFEAYPNVNVTIGDEADLDGLINGASLLAYYLLARG